MAVSKSGTLVANEVEEITVDVDRFGDNNQIGILNRSQEGVIWVRTDGEDPEVEGDNSFPVMQYRIFSAKNGYSSFTVKMVADVDVDYTVEGTG